MTRAHQLVITIISFIIALSYDFLFNDQGLGLNFFIFTLIWLVGVLGLELVVARRRLNNWAFLLSIPMAWYAGSTFVYSGIFVQSVAPLATWLVAVVFLFWLGVGAGRVKLKEVKNIIPVEILFFAGNFLGKITAPWRDLLNVKRVNNNKLLHIGIGLVILCPLLLIFGVLFFQADLIYREWVKNLFDVSIDPTLVWRILRTIILTLFGGGVLWTMLLPRNIKAEEAVEDNNNPKEHLIAATLLVCLNLFFAVFIAIQFMFLFGGHEIITKYNITYSEYAHQGFFQLVFVACLVLIISSVVYVFNYYKKKFDFVMVLLLLFIGQTMVIVASALKRMFLYMEVYGQTYLRFLVWHFIVYLGLILIGLLLVVIIKKHYHLFVKVVMVVSMIYLMYLTGINIEGKIAGYNINRYIANNNKFDISYLTTFSVDAYDSLAKLSSVSDDAIRVKLNQWMEQEKNHVASWSWPEYTVSGLRFLSLIKK